MLEVAPKANETDEGAICFMNHIIIILHVEVSKRGADVCGPDFADVMKDHKIAVLFECQGGFALHEDGATSSSEPPTLGGRQLLAT
ncbi:hypothetical protein MRB53_012963 [Persea americana]|uniref:Uncharacterized protein n=1 Tax=Persea americana TaxID=3435 RepID=A0ACC2LYT5_PERAE|nr:hypothetical protein MRB53_012963 [Persea americana]